MRKLRADSAQFIADYHDAATTGMSLSEFCSLTGLSIPALHSRIETFAKRGVYLPLLVGMRKASKMGKRLGVDPRKRRRAVAAPAVMEQKFERGIRPVTFQVCVGNGF